MKPYESYLIGQAAFRNAQEYADQADLLAERGWHGRSLSLAILGQEELGKATYFTLLAVGRLKYKPRAILEMFRVHTAKQRMSQVYAAFESLAENSAIMEFFRDAVEPVVREIPDDLSAESEERLQLLFRQLRTRLDSYAAARPEIADAFREELPKALERAWIASLDPEKCMGLYVDYEETAGVIRSPAMLTESQAAVRRLELRKKLSSYRDSTPLIPDEATLERLRKLSGAPLTLEEQP
jgi:AbiV family abortive infection protein